MDYDIVEILSNRDLNEAVQRIKIQPIVTLSGNRFKFHAFGQGGVATKAVIINGLLINLNQNNDLLNNLRSRKIHALVMMIIPDFNLETVRPLQLCAEFVDVFLVPTPEMQNFVSAFTTRAVELLFDPIDFGLLGSVRRPISSNIPKIVWFGYPESYSKSMTIYESSLFAMHDRREIEYHIVTKNNKYGKMAHCIIHEYKIETFLDLLSEFDICISSHMPLDFSMSTYWKSENKAVLAINRGLPVIASRTPAHERLFSRYSIDSFLFRSDSDLLYSLNKIKNPDERILYLDKAQGAVLRDYNANKMVKEWRDIYHRQRKRKFG